MVLINGTTDADSLLGSVSDDEINGYAGDDYIDAGHGNNILYGGLGNDTSWGGDGNDTIYGGLGNDILEGGWGNDSIYGEEGDDRISGGDGNNFVSGGDGNDYLAQGNNTGIGRILGGLGDDQIQGGGEGDSLYGEEGSDIISGNGGNDFLDGGSGDDLISGMSGDDTLVGGPGNDRLEGDGALNHEPTFGTDLVIYSDNSTRFSLILGTNDVTYIKGNANIYGEDQLVSCEFVEFSDVILELSWFHKTNLLNEVAKNSLVELYIASFNRAPDAIGLNYWGGRLYDGMTLPEIAKSFFVQPETVAAYPSSMPTRTFVSTVYNNVLSRAPDIDGLNYWVREIETGNISKDVFLLAIINGANASTGSAIDRETLANKVVVGNYFALDNGLSETAWGIHVMDGVSSDLASITAARSLVDLYGAAITDVSDTLAPTVISFSPTDNATDVTVFSNVVLTFSEAIARGIGSIVLRSGSATGAVIETFDLATSESLSISDRTLTINPTNDLSGSTQYFVTLASGAIMDLAGNNYAGTTTYDFRTVATDTTAPTVSTFSPTDGATGVLLTSDVVLTFSEAIQRGTGSILLRSGSATGTVVETFDAATSTRLSISGGTLTIDPTSNLSGSTQYFVTLASGAIMDLAGNNYAGTTTYDFTSDSIASLFPGASTVWNGSSGDFYGLYKVRKTWNDAKAFAENLGGYLVKVDDNNENQELFIMLTGQLSLSDLNNARAPDGGRAAYVWLGASDATVEGTWEWTSDASNLSTARTEWGEGALGSEPDNYNNQDYLALGMENWPYGSTTGVGYGDAGEWNDLAGSNLLYFVVEIALPA